MTAPTLPIEALLGHAHWVRGLARRLVRDPDLADDLVQDTWLEAVQNPPRNDENPRGWLGTVLRRRWSRRAREDSSRRQRERAGQPRDPEQPDELLARLEAHQGLVACVRALPEPYRSVVLLRFLEGVPPREIARRRGAPVATVHSQLQRGLALLREAMDRRCGGRRAWIAAIVGLPRGGPVLLTWMIAMQTKKLLITVAVAMILVSTWALWPRSADALDTGKVEVGSASAPASTQMAQPAELERKSIALAEPMTLSVTSDAALFAGRVLDTEGQVLPGMQVVMRGERPGNEPHGPEEPALSDGDGRFELPIPESRVYLSVQQPGWTTVLEGVADDAALDSGIEPVVVAAPTVTLTGTVTSEGGLGVPGATIDLGLPPDLRMRMRQAMDRSTSAFFQYVADDNGSFALTEVPAVRGAEILVRASGYLPERISQPRQDTGNMMIVLDRPRPEPGTLLGQVLDPFGAAVAGAHVILGRSEARSGEDGHFGLSLAAAKNNRELIAMQRGYRPARHQLTRGESTGETFIHLQLTEPTLFAGGRVIDEEGRPVANAWVWVDDPEILPMSRGVFSAEAFLGGGATEEELIARYVVNGRMVKSEDEIMREQPTGLWGFVRSDSDGAFRLGGLSQRAYRLQALDSQSYAKGTATVEAGTSAAVIVVGREGFLPELRVHLVAHDGSPLSGVKVRMRYKVLELGWTDGNSVSQTVVAGSRDSDAEGRVRFEQVNPEQGQLEVQGDSILPGRRPFPDDLDSRGEWVVQLDRRIHLRVEISAPEPGTLMGAVDEFGEPAPFYEINGEYYSSFSRMGVEARTEILAVSDRIVALVFTRDGQEVHRLPVSLLPGIVNEVRW